MKIRTIVNLDGFFWVSSELWNDATFACDDSKAGWQRVSVSQETKLCRILGDLAPQYDGENAVLDEPIEWPQ